MPNLTANELITAAIAIYGALMATFTFATQQIDKRKKIRVTISLGFAAFRRDTPIDVVSIEAANFGNVPVHLSKCQFNFPSSKEKMMAVFKYDKNFPITLNPGESIVAMLESEKFVQLAKSQNLPNEILVNGEYSNKGNGIFRSKNEKWKIDEMLFAKESAAKSAA